LRSFYNIPAILLEQGGGGMLQAVFGVAFLNTTGGLGNNGNLGNLRQTIRRPRNCRWFKYFVLVPPRTNKTAWAEHYRFVL